MGVSVLTLIFSKTISVKILVLKNIPPPVIGGHQSAGMEESAVNPIRAYVIEDISHLTIRRNM